ncbi:unnamed protein product [Ostreobium quekettii]|uniref:BTB domain-containing protein n=1 Tax=Ostreobium quekettii TaxID=121088 RepID=A0A8S1JD99_9CHLO|nr:unnamed protein product [Ostreobium quekettii]|eukprot:evm.model.scf_1610.2 EVM.evm.TU.scf_1610.2   scf_1610:32816-34076(-)
METSRSSVNSTVKKSSYMPLENDYAKLCDMTLVAEGKPYPAHGAMLAFHSQFFRKMLVDLQSPSALHTADNMVITLDESVSAADARLMLAILYGKRTKLKTAKEAWNMVHLGDKYESKILMNLAEDMISCSPLYFCGSPLSFGSMQDEHLNACVWLGVADRLGLERIRKQCQFVILRDLESNFRCSAAEPMPKAAVDSLSQHGMSARSICELLAAFMKLSPVQEHHVCTRCKKVQDPKQDQMMSWAWAFRSVLCRCPVCKHEGSPEAFTNYKEFKCATCQGSLVKIAPDTAPASRNVLDIYKALDDVKGPLHG